MHFNALIPELAVVSLGESLAFYCGLLGFSVAYQRKDEGFAFIELGAAQLMLDEIGIGRTFDGGEPLARPLGRGLNLQIEIADIAPLVAALQAVGWPLYLPPEERWYRQNDIELGNRQFVVADPDGYLLRLAQKLGTRRFG